MGTQVTEAGRREQGVADRVGRDISVGMPGETRLMWPEQPGKIQRPTITKWMDVRPHAYLRQQARHDNPALRQPATELRSSHRNASRT
jgi:hypothetical protein